MLFWHILKILKITTKIPIKEEYPMPVIGIESSWGWA